ncbi:hypothetical protein BDC45DRAFT_577099 [Circinella umbellata]|nr:hypothetical protein BDC45DRAFT_577099 [Circinella umbellata]
MNEVDVDTGKNTHGIKNTLSVEMLIFGEHDYIFALADIIPDVMKESTIDYNQDIEDYMIRFYGALAEKDMDPIYHFGQGLMESLRGTTIGKRHLEIILSELAMAKNPLSTEYLHPIIQHIQELAHFIPIEKGDIQWLPTDTGLTIRFICSYLTELLDDSSHQTLLTGAQFKHDRPSEKVLFCPVLKKSHN